MWFSIIWAAVRALVTWGLSFVTGARGAQKTQEAINAANDVSRLDDTELDKRVLHDITRKP